MRRFLFLSILIHGAILALIVMALSRFSEPRPVLYPVTVTVTKGGKSGSSSSRQSLSRSSTPPKAQAKDKSIQGPKKAQNQPRSRLKLGLVPREALGPSGTPGSVEGRGGPGGSGGEGPTDGYEIANRMSLETEGKLFPFYKALWLRINNLTIYPSDFVEQRIEGKVTAQLSVDHRGVLTGGIHSIHAGEPMLRALVVATLVQALREPLPENQWTKEKGGTLVVQFDFVLIGLSHVPTPVDIPHSKNVFSFRREAQVEPALNRAIEKLFTRYIPPVIVFPGFVYVDFYRLYQFVNHFVRPELDEEKLLHHRLEMKKEELERFIQKDQLGNPHL